MRVSIGVFLLGVAGIVASILAAALRWPWPWWAFGIIAFLAFVAALLMLQREHKQPDTSFIEGDPDLVVATDVASNAAKFIKGSPRQVFLERVLHVPFGWRIK
jgi:MFS family permease